MSASATFTTHMKTILITGTSSGIGRATVRHFSNNGWRVVATMRNPDKETEMQHWPNVVFKSLDVTNQESIDRAISTTIKEYGHIDVLVNNAGYGAVGIFEASTPEQIQRQFDTNVFGVMNVIRTIIPHFRERRAGTIINVSSVGGRVTFPLYSVYHGTKWAVEGFAESLHYELKPFNIKVKNVEPGPIKTDFYDRSQDLFHKDGLDAYKEYEQRVLGNSKNFGANAPGPEVVAKTIWKAANDDSFRLRYASDFLGRFTLFTRKLVPLSWYFGIIRMLTERKSA
jgi:NAD(P)-dependent dehydrogenase (short-subunit alcohol dehydrogenase family)